MNVRIIVEERPFWRPSIDYLLGDLEVHYAGCPGTYDCMCELVDPEAQLDAIYRGEEYYHAGQSWREDLVEEWAQRLAPTTPPWDGCHGCGNTARFCCCPGVNFGDAVEV
jgi:hypothetical protein